MQSALHTRHAASSFLANNQKYYNLLLIFYI